MDRKQVVIQSGLSLLCVAVLAACGGGGGGKLTNAGSNFPGRQVDSNATTTLPNVQADPSSVTLFRNITSENGNSTYGGLQTKSIVVSLDVDKNGQVGKYDQISFNQPGVISEICAGMDCHGAQQLTDRINEQIAIIDKQISALQSASSGSATGTGNTTPTANADTTSQIERLQRQRVLLQASLPQENVVYMNDVAGNLHAMQFHSDVDDAPASFKGNKLISRDAGIVKLDGEYIKDANGKRILVERAGFIDRAYNGIVAFPSDFTAVTSTSKESPTYLNAYLRHPSAAGWSYNTFGVFASTGLTANRDIHRGYQSVGMQVSEMPNSGKASYSGISHAYYNNDQVTMNVKVDADFDKKKLNLSTSDATLHTFTDVKVGNQTVTRHYIEKMPDLNISGSASWKDGSGHFEGTSRNQGGNLSGGLDGRFYGPQAAEVGGVYGMQNQDGSIQYLGGFGAKKD